MQMSMYFSRSYLYMDDCRIRLVDRGDRCRAAKDNIRHVYAENPNMQPAPGNMYHHTAGAVRLSKSVLESGFDFPAASCRVHRACGDEFSISVDKKNHIDGLGAGLLLLCSVIVGINQVLIKLVNAGLAPVFQAGLRSACAFFPVLLFALVMKRKLAVRDGSLLPGLVVGLFFSLEFMMMFLSLDYIAVSRASVLFYTMPFWAAVGAHFLIPGERLTVSRLIGLFLAVAGVMLALSDNQWEMDARALSGDMFCLIGAMLWASIVLVARTTALSRSSPEMQLLYQLGMSSILLLSVAPFFGEPIREMTATVITLFSIQVLVVVSFSFLLWFWLLSVYPASRMASYSFLAPVFGVFFGWLILDEALTEHILLALMLVSIGVYLVSRKPALRAPRQYVSGGGGT